MHTATPARVVRPIALIAAIGAIAGAIGCGDITPPSAPEVIAPTRDASFSGYALASGKVDSTSTLTSKNH